MFTLTATLSVSPVDVPLVGDRESQVALSDTLQLSVPPPPLEIERVWFGGLEPPWAALNVMDAGLRTRAGAGGATTRVTAVVWGEPVAGAAPVTVMVPL
jgi:hypothetical protein